MTVAAQPRYLLFPDPIRPGEDLFGYLLRRAERGGAASIHALGRISGLTKRAMRLTHFAEGYDRLAEVLREKPERLQAASFSVVGRLRNSDVIGFAGQRLRRNAIAYPKCRVCPACLAADGHAHQIWEITALTECPRHRVRLVDQCSACGKRLTWSRGSLLRCNCGFDLRRLPCEPSSVRALALSTEIAQLALAEAPALFPTVAADPSDRLQSFVSLCWWTGARVLGRRNTKNTTHRPDLSDARTLLEAAGTILVDPEDEGYFRFLDRIFIPPAKAGGRLPRMFPGWYRGLGELEFLAPLRPGLERYLQARHPEQFIKLAAKSRPTRENGVARTTISVTEASQRTGRTTRAILALARELGIQPIVIEAGPRQAKRHFTNADFDRIVEATLGDRPVLPPRPPAPDGICARRSAQHGGTLMIVRKQVTETWSRIPFLAGDLAATFPPALLVPPTAIADRLGIDMMAAYALINSKVFARFRSQTGDLGPGGLTVQAYAAFERALAAATLPSAPDTEPQVVLTKAYKGSIRRHGVDFGTMLNDLLDGALGPVHRTGKHVGLRGLTVARSAVARYAAQAQRVRLKDFATSKQVTELIGGNHRLVSYLRKTGHLKTTQSRMGGSYGYDRAGVERFYKTYINLQEIVRRRLFPEFGRLPAWLSRHLQGDGIRPVMAPDLDGAPMTFYRRVEIEKYAARLRTSRNKAAKPGRDGETDHVVA